MSPSDRKRLPFRVRAENRDDATRLTVFDGRNRICIQATGAIDTGLPKGLYQVRLERLGAMEDHLIIHDEATDMDLPLPRRQSAMPATDTRFTHEFYQGPGVTFSKKSTRADPDNTAGLVRLMIMLRASGERDSTGVSVGAGLTLFAADGRRITGFEPQETQADTAAGWQIFSALIAPGPYLLVLVGEQRAEFLPISLHAGWDSMVFVPHENGLRLSQSSLDMVRHGRGFDPSDDLAQKIDGAMKGLGENLDLLPGDMRREAIYGKFSHPLHGLIGAHAHFLSGRQQERLEQQVLRNLWRLLPGSPDVVALLLMAQERTPEGLPETIEALQKIAREAFGPEHPPQFPLAFPPMLRPGLRAVIRASVGLSDLIAEGSWCEAAALSSFDGGGAWAVWDQERGSVTRVLELPPDGPSVPSSQKVYAAIKRAIAAQTGEAMRNVRAASRVRDVLSDPGRAMRSMMREVATDLGDRTVRAVTPDPADRVRDVMRTVQARVRDAQTRTIEIAPQTALPDWLVEFARGALDDLANAPDLRSLSRQAGVPLRQMRQAVTRASEGEGDAAPAALD
jgi:hypothetical protein